MSVFPGLAILITVLAINLFGEGLSDVLIRVFRGAGMSVGVLDRYPCSRSRTLDRTAGRRRPDVRGEDVSFAIGRNEVVCLVGESGSGKSMIAACDPLTAAKGVGIVSGAVKVAGHDTSTLDRRAMRRLRGGEAAMIFQEPLSSLNPLKRVGEQIEETILTHHRPVPSAVDIKARVQEL